ncbi:MULTISPECIES: hypothetical protein [Variovorax]|uniref:hypothetical protein n=1 Tax=Variovorax TaxID=34072 RepID=UPI001AC38497|nr:MULTISPECIES: hypothetical protein [Variovorax]MBN8754947.1 hypothetical protein [Variovorax sp.]UKI05239.1 hypothetical protein L3V85_20635 [Variovorax paradoxus]
MGIADEGVYLLAARYPMEIEQNVSAVFDYTGAVFRLVGYHPALFRLAGLAAIMLSAVAFWAGFQKLLLIMFPGAKHAQHLRLNSLLFIQLGGILYYQWAFATPNYYTLTAISLNLFAGFVMWALALETLKPRNVHTTFFFGVAGLALGSGVFVRFTSAALVLGCLFALLWYWPGVGRMRRIRLLLTVGVGMVVWSGFHFIAVQGPVRQWEMFTHGWQLYQAIGTHSPGAKIFAYPRDLFALGLAAFLAFWPCHLLVAAALLVPRVARRRFALLAIFRPSVVAALVLVVAAVLSWRVGANVLASRLPASGGVSIYLSFYSAWILVLIAVYALFAMQPADVRPECDPAAMQCRGLVLFLLGLPIAGSVGTANPLYNVISFYAVPWFGLVFLLGLALIARYKARPALLLGVMAVMGGVTCSQVVQGSVQAPSQVSTGLQLQAIPTEVGFPAHWMKLDSESHKLIEQLRAAAVRSGFTPGDDIVAVSYLPGLVYAMGGRSPGHPTFLLGTPGYLAYSKMALGFAEKARVRAALVLLDLDAHDAELQLLLGSAEMDFPAGYNLLGEVTAGDKTYRLFKPSL